MDGLFNWHVVDWKKIYPNQIRSKLTKKNITQLILIEFLSLENFQIQIESKHQITWTTSEYES